MRPHVEAFYDQDTGTLSYVVFDEDTRDGVIIDPICDFDQASGRIEFKSVKALLKYVNVHGVKVHMLMETHAHADHISGSQFLKAHLGGVRVAIGRHVTEVQRLFQKAYWYPDGLATDGSQFDLLLVEETEVAAGSLRFRVIHTPGHTPACCAYVFDGLAFCGDSLFMPDYGTGRCDFPGGSAATLYDSIVDKIYRLPDDTLLCTGHDYCPGGRNMRFGATVREQKDANIHLKTGTTRDEFVAFRQGRDKALNVPKLLHASVQVNVQAGKLPAKLPNGGQYVMVPLSVGEF